MIEYLVSVVLVAIIAGVCWGVGRWLLPSPESFASLPLHRYRVQLFVGQDATTYECDSYYYVQTGFVMRVHNRHIHIPAERYERVEMLDQWGHG